MQQLAVGSKRPLKKVFESSESIFLDDISSDVMGEKRFKEVNCLPIHNNIGDVVQVAIVSRDVTEDRKKQSRFGILI